MCGILGTLNISLDQEILDLILHRGPDDAGTVRMIVGRHAVALGHRRLSILDFSPAGHQPMWSAGGQHALVFNGEIYNHLDFRDGSQVRYRGHSDTETILYQLARKGISSVQQFNGIFAFGFLDAVNQKLFLARDPFGVKPLYYWSDSRSLIFSSELLPIRALVDDSLDVDRLSELLRLRYLPAPDTLFKTIRKVRPGHIVEVDLGEGDIWLREYPYLAAAPDEMESITEADAKERYGFLLEQAIQRQLLSDVEVGILLSGGVDSALVAHFAQKHAAYRVKSFTVGFSERADADEIAEASETAALLGLEHHDVRIGFPQFLDVLPRIVATVEEPLASTSVVPMFYLSELVSEHAKVVMSGQGADEALGGYRRYRMELLRRFVPSGAASLLRKGAGIAGMRSDWLLRGLEAMAETDDVRRFEAAHGVFTASQIQRLTGHEPALAHERIAYWFDLLQCANQRTSAQRMMSTDLRMNLADDLLLYTDKITMRYSIECRVPFLDMDLIRFTESLPCHFRVGLGGGKRLHKRFAESVLPASIVRRKKKGFLSPTGNWFSTRNEVREILLERGSPFSSWIDLAEVERTLDEHASGLNRERHIFLLLGLHFWMKEWLGDGARSKDASQLVRLRTRNNARRLSPKTIFQPALQPEPAR
ncbi:MAG: asparagine synthase (glutamine-hydrolyzing) [Acidobacteriota bacterium]